MYQIFSNFNWQQFLPLIIAVALGGLTGLEREIHRKPAGLRTNILICMGAALITIMGQRIFSNSDSFSRLLQGAITGVGFIGGGAIIRDRAGIHGITTAATIWLNTGIGITCGMRLYELAVGTTFITLVVLLGLSPLDRKIHPDVLKEQSY